MRSVPVLAAVIIGAAVIAGCGQQHPGSGAAAAPSQSPSPSGSSSGVSVACRSAQPARHASKLVVTAADNGRSFCVIRGTNVVVLLMGTPDRKWRPIQASSAALQPHANGELSLPVGATGASFLAVRPGTAVIISGRPACGPASPQSNGTPGSGTLECGAILVFRVTVTVVGLTG
jgi:hypothetical protein